MSLVKDNNGWKHIGQRSPELRKGQGGTPTDTKDNRNGVKEVCVR